MCTCDHHLASTCMCAHQKYILASKNVPDYLFTLLKYFNELGSLIKLINAEYFTKKNQKNNGFLQFMKCNIPNSLSSVKAIFTFQRWFVFRWWQRRWIFQVASERQQKMFSTSKSFSANFADTRVDTRQDLVKCIVTWWVWLFQVLTINCEILIVCVAFSLSLTFTWS